MCLLRTDQDIRYKIACVYTECLRLVIISSYTNDLGMVQELHLVLLLADMGKDIQRSTSKNMSSMTDTRKYGLMYYSVLMLFIEHNLKESTFSPRADSE